MARALPPAGKGLGNFNRIRRRMAPNRLNPPISPIHRKGKKTRRLILSQTLRQSRKFKHQPFRIMGVQHLARLQSLIRGWADAFKMCGETVQIVVADRQYYVDQLRQKYMVTDEEIQKWADRSFQARFHGYQFL